MNAETEPRSPDARARDDAVRPEAADRVRGGLSAWSILSGVLVAFGAFVILSAILGAVLAAAGLAEDGIRPEQATAIGLGAGVGVVLAQFLAYLWGGYTAGRMARGSGVGNGLAVPIVGLLLVLALGGMLAAVTDATRAADMQQLPLPLGRLTDIVTGVGIGLLVAMFLGGALGGMTGARWHAKLEDRALRRPSA